MTIQWDDSRFKKDTITKAMDGLEEWCMVEWEPQSKMDSPVKTGTMRASLGHERDDLNLCCYVGGGGAASAYILRQEMDRSFNHPVGKAGFIHDSVDLKAPKIKEYVQKHINSD